MRIRKLRADEIDVRVSTINDKGMTLLLYKDARVDMNILDETFGVNMWQRSHEVINGNLFCTVEIWNSEIGQWVKKQDVGVESYTEKEKGQASDAFKRACFNVGIGRELYTSPFIWVANKDDVITNNSGKKTTYTKFKVKEISYNDNREIDNLIIIDNKGKQRFTTNTKNPKPTNGADNYREKLVEFTQSKGLDMVAVAQNYKINKSTTNQRFKEVLEQLTAKYK